MPCFPLSLAGNPSCPRHWGLIVLGALWPCCMLTLSLGGGNLRGASGEAVVHPCHRLSPGAGCAGWGSLWAEETLPDASGPAIPSVPRVAQMGSWALGSVVSGKAGWDGRSPACPQGDPPSFLCRWLCCASVSPLLLKRTLAPLLTSCVSLSRAGDLGGRCGTGVFRASPGARDRRDGASTQCRAPGPAPPELQGTAGTQPQKRLRCPWCEPRVSAAQPQLWVT